MFPPFIQVAAAVPVVAIADCDTNAKNILALIRQAVQQEVEIVCFPELCLTGSTCGDLFLHNFLIEQAQQSLSFLLENTRDNKITCIVGMPVIFDCQRLNVAVVFREGKILGVVPKNNLTISEQHYFYNPEDEYLSTENKIILCGQAALISTNITFENEKFCFNVLVGDVCAQKSETETKRLIFNISSTNEIVGNYAQLKEGFVQLSQILGATCIYTSAGFGESTTDFVFAGNALITQNGKILTESNRFSTSEQLIISDINLDNLSQDISQEIYEEYEIQDLKFKQQHPFVLSHVSLSECCDEAFNIQTMGLVTRLHHTNIQKAVVGISGGLDSTMALLVAVAAFDKLGLPRTNIWGITMPGFGTTNRTYQNAVDLIKNLGITFREINIKDSCLQHFKDINHSVDDCNVVYENAQARERTQILMDIANQQGALVVGTGDMSELALGWATFGGDHLSMYGVNAGVPKTMMRHLVRHIAQNNGDEAVKSILIDILDTPVSPELLPTDEKGCISQKTEDLVGPYELHDFFLYHFLHGESPTNIYHLAVTVYSYKYDAKTISLWLKVFFRRFFSQQFKRSCMPDGPKVFDVSLSPRGSWAMPSDISAKMWLAELEKL